jgi:hypothetical protein
VHDKSTYFLVLNCTTHMANSSDGLMVCSQHQIKISLRIDKFTDCPSSRDIPHALLQDEEFNAKIYCLLG